MTQEERDFMANIDLGGLKLRDLPGFEQPKFQEMALRFLAACGMTSPEGLEAADHIVEEPENSASIRTISSATRIPRNFLVTPYDDGYHAAWSQSAKAFLGLVYAGHPTSFWLGGPTGRGKSHLAASIARELFEAGRPTLWINVPIFFDLIMDGYEIKTAKAEATDLKNRAATCSILVLDDIGKYNTYSDGRTMSFLVNQLYRIIETRRDGKITIYTSEFPSTGVDLESRLSGAIVERINENLVRAGAPPPTPYRQYQKQKGHDLPFEEIAGKVG